MKASCEAMTRASGNQRNGNQNNGNSGWGNILGGILGRP